MKRMLAIFMILAFALLTGCGSDPGNEFIGKWVSIKNNKHTLKIERNGKSFIVRSTEPSFISGKLDTQNIPGTFKDGVIQMSLGFGTLSLAIDKTSGHLTDGQSDYTRVKE